MARQKAFRVVEPVMVTVEDPTGQEARLLELTGKRIGALWNSRDGGDEALRLLLDELAERYGVEETKLYRKRTATVPADVELLDQIAAEVDAAITGVGD
jgi:hypothetical protein